MIRPKTSDWILDTRRAPPLRGAGRESGIENRESRIEFGFTLVELLVVIAIIALLLSILTPSLTRARAMAIRIKCAHNLKQINLAVNLYINGNDETYPCAQDPLPAGYWLWMGRGWRAFVEPYLGGNIDVNNPSVLFCPADPTAKDKYESTSYAYSMTFYHSPRQINTVTITQDHKEQWHIDFVQESVAQKDFNVAHPSGKILIGEWLSNHLPIDKDGGWWCRQGRRNYLFADGQVRYLKAEQIRPARDGFPNPNLTVRGIKGLDYPSN